MRKKGKSFRSLVLIGTLGALAGIFVVQLNPVNSTLFKLITLGLIAASWLGLLTLFWKWKRARKLVLLLPILAAVPFLIPGRTIDREVLREDYLQRMAGFEGTEYYWGGESGRGIDCSGLPRRAYRDALLAYGFRTVNGRAFRSWIEQWWFDASAKALGQGYRGYTVPLETKGTIREMSYEKLEPGDLAVTQGGVHILAYVGEGKWIQADPGLAKVATLDGRSSDNVWFGVPATTYRWKHLSKE